MPGPDTVRIRRFLGTASRPAEQRRFSRLVASGQDINAGTETADRSNTIESADAWSSELTEGGEDPKQCEQNLEIEVIQGHRVV
jgi:hypothetical protein